MNLLGTVMLYALIPSFGMVIGGITAAFRQPTKQITSYTQHFAAGIVFAALAGEVLPEAMGEHPEPIDFIIGFALGVVGMLAMRWFTEKKLGKPKKKNKEKLPLSLIITVAIDVFVDGLLIGIGFAAGASNGILLTIALAIEITFLGLSTAAEMVEGRASRQKTILITSALALPILVSAGLGATIFSNLSGHALLIVLAFGAAALLYLVTEELLVEAHEVPENLVSTTSFFAGFLGIFVIEMLVG